MATSSPAPSNNSTDTATTPNTSSIATSNPSSITAIRSNSPSKASLTPLRDPPKSLRGLNKPKCSQCGNVARSRCPFLSCKSCCAKAQNPCHIHVLKQSGILPDKTPSSTTSIFDQKTTDASPPGTSLRVSSLRQLSQFNGSQLPYRARRPLTKKDAVSLNQWRFSKLKEHRERNIETENEAFDRYMQNVTLLEEIFLVNEEEDDNKRRMIVGVKAELRANPKRVENFRKRVGFIVENGLRKLTSDDEQDLKKKKRVEEKALGVDEVVEKLNKARNEEELQVCLEMKDELFNEEEEEKVVEEDMLKEGEEVKCLVGKRLWGKVDVDEETLSRVDKHFSSLDQIEDL